ncbi:MAG: hypothetical protein ACK452_09625, partial [Bacteroidota bacterium]
MNKLKCCFYFSLFILNSCVQDIRSEHKNLIEIANELNNQCPKIIDHGTRWDKVSASGNVLELAFTLIKTDKDSIDAEGLTKEIKSLLIKNLSGGFNLYKSHLDLAFIKQNRIIFHYVYL